MENTMLHRLQVSKERLKEIDEELSTDSATSDLNRFRDLSKERANLEPVVEKFDEYVKAESDSKDAFIMTNDSDPEISEMGKEEYKTLNEKMDSIIEELRIMLLPKDPNDDKNIIVEIRGAVGGEESDLFASDLFRMYTRYAENMGWKIQLLDESPSEGGGFSFISFMIKGDSVYSKLKFESGAHRVDRKSTRLN